MLLPRCLLLASARKRSRLPPLSSPVLAPRCSALVSHAILVTEGSRVIAFTNGARVCLLLLTHMAARADNDSRRQDQARATGGKVAERKRHVLVRQQADCEKLTCLHCDETQAAHCMRTC